jgi:hypothetical protein
MLAPSEVDAVRRVIDRRVPWAVHDEIFSHQSFGTGPALPQGWKLHVSATPFSAVEVLEAALEVLLMEGARFKVVKSTELLRSLNAGQFGLSQIGKFITVYPSDNAGAVALAIKLDEVTSDRRGPRVPTDRPLKPGSLVHYRYGGMHQRLDWEAASEGTNGNYALRDAAGRLTNDVRAHYYLLPPAGIVDPFEAANAYVARPPRDTLLNGRYLVFNAFLHGLRGGVFRAIDLGAEPARLLALAIQPRQVFARRCRDARGLRQPPQKLLVTLARVPPHNRAHRRVRLQRRRINRDPLAFQQPTIGQHAQHPAEYFAMRVQIDQPPRARNRRVIRRVLVQRDAHETPQGQRVRQPPGNAALRPDALEIPDQQRPKVTTVSVW